MRDPSTLTISFRPLKQFASSLLFSAGSSAEGLPLRCRQLHFVAQQGVLEACRIVRPRDPLLVAQRSLVLAPPQAVIRQEGDCGSGKRLHGGRRIGGCRKIGGVERRAPLREEGAQRREL
jgi:hypothetical protein